MPDPYPNRNSVRSSQRYVRRRAVQRLGMVVLASLVLATGGHFILGQHPGRTALPRPVELLLPRPVEQSRLQPPQRLHPAPMTPPVLAPHSHTPNQFAAPSAVRTNPRQPIADQREMFLDPRDTPPHVELRHPLDPPTNSTSENRLTFSPTSNSLRPDATTESWGTGEVEIVFRPRERSDAARLANNSIREKRRPPSVAIRLPPTGPPSSAKIRRFPPIDKDDRESKSTSSAMSDFEQEVLELLPALDPAGPPLTDKVADSADKRDASQSDTLASEELPPPTELDDEPSVLDKPAENPDVNIEDLASHLNFHVPNESSDWWHRIMLQPFVEESTRTVVSLDQLVPAALQHSKRIRIAKLDTFIEQEQITQVDAEFDWRVFTEKLWRDQDDPASTQLDGAARIEQQDLSFQGGVRRRNRLGGELDLSQEIRGTDSNSQFFQPADQGSSNLVLRYNQPILKDGGLLVNQGQVVLAQLESLATNADSEAEISEIILDVVDAYWQLYARRAEFLIQNRQYENNSELLRILKKRSRIDARRALIAQVETTMASNRAATIRAGTRLQQAQNAVIRLVGRRNLAQFAELLPEDRPIAAPVPINPQQAVTLAMQHRADLRANFKRMQASGLARDIAKRQLLPRLALVLEANALGINGDFKIGQSLVDQFVEGGPTYSVGLSFEYALGNRSARSRARETELIVARELALFQDRVDQIRLEVEDAITALAGAQHEMEVRAAAVVAAKQEISSLNRRRRIFPGQLDEVSQQTLQQILLANQRLANAEIELVAAQTAYSIEHVQLRQAVGTLLFSL